MLVVRCEVSLKCYARKNFGMAGFTLTPDPSLTLPQGGGNQASFCGGRRASYFRSGAAVADVLLSSPWACKTFSRSSPLALLSAMR